MKLELVKLQEFSSTELGVYTFLDVAMGFTLLDKFIHENVYHHKAELIHIFSRIQAMSNRKIGARSSFFKEVSGLTHVGMHTLYYSQTDKLRLYCIRLGTSIVIYGSGGAVTRLTRSKSDLNLLSIGKNRTLQLANSLHSQIEHSQIVVDLEQPSISPFHHFIPINYEKYKSR